MLLNAALNMIDDAVFTMMDMANGMDPMAALEGLGKKALVSLASSSISGVANGFNAAQGAVNGVAAGTATTTSKTIVNSGLKGVLGLQNSVVGSTLLKGTELMATNITSSAINSVNVKGLLTGGDAFDENAFKQGAFGKGAMTSVFAGMTGTYVSGKINNWNLGNNAMKVNGFNSGQINDIGGIGSLAGGLTGSAITYGLTGNATFNLARINGVGIMEMHVGNDGFGMNLGMGGTDVSMGTLGGALRGFRHLEMNNKIELAAQANKMDVATMLRSQYGFGDVTAREQLNGIIARSTLLMDGKGLPKGARGETTTENGKRVVYLAGYHEGMTSEEQMNMGITLQHEAYRDGVASGNNKAETQLATYAHTLIAERMMQDTRYSSLMGNIISSDANLASDFAMLNKARESKNLGMFASYVDDTYDSTGDYWLLKKDGTVVDDGSADWHWEAVTKDTDANGQPIYKTIKSANGETKEESLVDGLGGAEKTKQILTSKGVVLNGSETNADLGALITSNLSNPSVASALNIDYSNLSLGRDYRAIYNSYSAHQGFIDSQIDITKGRADLLLAGNGGEAITKKLEYYTLLYDQYIEQPEIAGSAYANDPAGYLVANLTKVSGHGLSRDIVVNKAIESALTTGLDRTAMYGGLIPPVDGGFSMRFKNNKDLDTLELSEHAMGFAVDFDPGMNKIYSIPQDTYLDSYLTAMMGKDPINAKGYSDQKALSILIAGYGSYLSNRQDELTTLLEGVSSYGMPQGYLNTMKQKMNTESKKIANIRSNINTYPTTRFSMGGTFVNTMRMNMNWGGDWWSQNQRQKDYMHFERK